LASDWRLTTSDRSKTATLNFSVTTVKEARHHLLLQSRVMPRPLRISAISFLNTAPLMWDFDHGIPPEPGAGCPQSVQHGFEVSYTIPSACAEALLAGTADIGIIPAITYATIPGLVILPDAVIAAKNEVRSILLVSHKPIDQVRTIAADTSSRTSVVLTQILCAKLWGGARDMRPMPPDVDSMLAACDAALLIGDSALRLDPAKYRSYDLAVEWKKLTGLPFVFAVWALRMAALAESSRDPDPATVLSRSRDHGTEPHNIDTMARLWSSHVHLAEPVIRAYLTRHIHYTLDAPNRAGLELFYRLAAELGLIPEAPSSRFYGHAAQQFVG
jgi:chorismate dehydratase